MPTFSTFQRMKILISQFYHDSEYAFPVKFIALHNFVNHWFRLESEHALSFWGQSLRTRLRFYDIAQQENNLRELADCGIGRAIIPSELGGMLDFDWSEFFRNQVLLDMMQASSSEQK